MPKVVKVNKKSVSPYSKTFNSDCLFKPKRCATEPSNDTVFTVDIWNRIALHLESPKDLCNFATTSKFINQATKRLLVLKSCTDVEIEDQGAGVLQVDFTLGLRCGRGTRVSVKGPQIERTRFGVGHTLESIRLQYASIQFIDVYPHQKTDPFTKATINFQDNGSVLNIEGSNFPKVRESFGLPTIPLLSTPSDKNRKKDRTIESLKVFYSHGIPSTGYLGIRSDNGMGGDSLYFRFRGDEIVIQNPDDYQLTSSRAEQNVNKYSADADLIPSIERSFEKILQIVYRESYISEVLKSICA